MSDSNELYVGREQAWVKHYILRNYLQRFAHIIGFHWKSITYVDGFSGPWNEQSDIYEDSSFAIAMEELRKARESHRERGSDIRLRCFFVEKTTKPYKRLAAYADSVEDIEIETENAPFEECVPKVVNFIKKDGSATFPFVFIDPKGWTGFGMQAIAPILRQTPGEVLINLMTGHLLRFIETESTQQSLEDLFGDSRLRETISGLSGDDRVDAIVEAYSRNVARTGGYRYVCPAVILHPQKERVHYHLIYATRDPKGIEVFKEVEKRAMTEMERARAEADQRHAAKGGQMSFLDTQDMPASKYYRSLRERYLQKAQRATTNLLRNRESISYDECWDTIIPFPLVWESDLKDWLKHWHESDLVVMDLNDRQRVPARGRGNTIHGKFSALDL